MKRLVYGSRGEPYRIGGKTLRYLPGTRPVRIRYARSKNATSRYDALQVRWLSTHLTEGDTAIDVGAHGGQYSILMSALCGQTGQVVSFEPDPYARALLFRNLDLNPDLKRPMVEPSAVSDVSGEALLYCGRGNSQSSLAPSGIKSTAETDVIRVTLVSLDDYLFQRSLAKPRWVKIDAEGAEILILRGATQMLAGETGVLCELHPYAWPGFGSTLGELRALAAAAGRRVRYLDQDSEIGEEATYGTVILERRS